jgi:hypothetical protein
MEAGEENEVEDGVSPGDKSQTVFQAMSAARRESFEVGGATSTVNNQSKKQFTLG